MTRQEQKARQSWFDKTTGIYAYGFIGTVLLFCVLMNPLVLWLGIGACMLLFVGSNVIFTGGTILSNPIRKIIDAMEKQEALIDHLGLVAEIIPRHWIFRKKEPKVKATS